MAEMHSTNGVQLGEQHPELTCTGLCAAHCVNTALSLVHFIAESACCVLLECIQIKLVTLVWVISCIVLMARLFAVQIKVLAKDGNIHRKQLYHGNRS